jgi:hypothetical protein
VLEELKGTGGLGASDIHSLAALVASQLDLDMSRPLPAAPGPPKSPSV